MYDDIERRRLEKRVTALEQDNIKTREALDKALDSTKYLERILKELQGET